MAREIYVVIFLLTVGNLAHCQEWENLLFIKMEELLEKQEAALSQLKGMQEKQEQVEGKLQEIQEKQEHVGGKLQEIQEKQEHVEGTLKEIQEKQEHVEGKLQEMQEKLQHVEINLQEFHHELEHVKGAVNSNQDSLQNISAKLETLEGVHRETKGCLRREDLEDFKNISSAGQKELESSLRQEISGVISLLETGGIDECSEGSHNCTDYEACTDKFVHFTCTCLSGFARDGSRCEDIDECAQGKDECSPLATCKNSVGSYSCSCNPPSEGDGRTCDIDECAQGKDECSPLATCRNSFGSYSCSCNPPFEGDGRTCSCHSGFAQEGSKCEDIDECAQGKDECSPQATCRNSVGSYSCSCNPPFEGDGRTCEFPCRSPAKVFEGLGCVKLVKERKNFEQMKATCHQAGGRFLQNFSVRGLQEVVQAFGTSERWIGVQDGKWLESGLPLQEELWTEGSQGSDSSGRRGLCGAIKWDNSSSYKVGEVDCSYIGWGYCQFINPQK